VEINPPLLHGSGNVQIEYAAIAEPFVDSSYLVAGRAHSQHPTWISTKLPGLELDSILVQMKGNFRAGDHAFPEQHEDQDPECL